MLEHIPSGLAAHESSEGTAPISIPAPSVCMYAWMNECMYVCMYVCMYAFLSVETSCGAHGTHLHIFKRHQPGDTVATNNHFRHVRRAKMRMPWCLEEKAQQLSLTGRAGPPEWRHSICSCSGQEIGGGWTTSQKQGNEKPDAEGQSGQVWPPCARHTAITSRVQSPTSEGIQLMPNLGQPVTQTTIRGRRGGVRTDRRCGGVDTRKLHGRSW